MFEVGNLSRNYANNRTAAHLVKQPADQSARKMVCNCVASVTHTLKLCESVSHRYALLVSVEIRFILLSLRAINFKQLQMLPGGLFDELAALQVL